MKPDIHGMAIEIAAAKGHKIPKAPAEDEAEPASPDQVSDAHEMIEAIKTGDGQSFANALCNFLDSYHGDDGATEPKPPEAPEDAAQAGP
jgi:hypothetical protein